MIESVAFDSWKVLVNDKPVTLAGDHTWFLVTHRPGEFMLSLEYIDRCASYGHNCARLWVWWPGEQEPLAPDPPATAVLNYLEDAVNYCLGKGIVPMVMLFTYYKQKPPWTLTGTDKQWMADVVERLKPYPLIWEICNEVPIEGYEWQVEAVSHLKALTTKPITVNTNSKGLVSKLIQSGAGGYAVLHDSTENYLTPEHTNLVGIADTDHLAASPWNVLNSKKASEKIAALQHFHDQGCRILLHMMAYEGSMLNEYPKPVNDPDNPSIPGVAEWLGEMATPLMEVEPPPPPKSDHPPGILDVAAALAPSYMSDKHVKNPEGAGWGAPYYDAEAGMILSMKHSKGFPFDGFWFDGVLEDGVIVDAGRIVHFITEDSMQGWSNEHGYKLHIPDVVWCPRYIPIPASGDFDVELTIPDTTFEIFADCDYESQHDVGLGAGRVQGLFHASDWKLEGYGVDPGHPVILLDWKWNQDQEVKVTERNYVAVGLPGSPFPGLGLIKHERWENGELVAEHSLKNQVLDGGAPEPLFPCMDLAALVAARRGSAPWTPIGEGFGEGTEPPPDWEHLTNDEFLAVCYDEIKVIRKPPPTSVKDMRAMQREWLRRVEDA